MKAWFLLVVLLGVWLAYQHHALPLPGARVSRRRKPQAGSVPTTTRGFGSRVSNIAKSGNSSPGSGTPAQQPALASTWAIGGRYNIGNIGVSYQ